jgi:hypothetical protein
MHKFVEENRVRIFRNERTRWSPIGPQTHILRRFGLFCYCTNSVQMGRTGPIDPQVCETKSHRNFRNERTRSTPFNPKLMFWGVSDRFVIARTWCKTCQIGGINAQVRGTKSHQNFSQRTHRIHPIGPQTNVLGRFGPFRYYTNFGAKRVEPEQLMHKFVK